MLITLLKIWVAISHKVGVRVSLSKGNNIFVHCNGDLRYQNQKNCYYIFFHVHLCWCICALWISFGKIIWLIVKYLSTKISISSFINW